MLRRLTVAVVACAALSTAACGGGGGGGGGAPAQAPTQSASVALAWEAADGPVAGYDLWVARNGGAFSREQSVRSQSATLKGDIGDSAQVAVGAYDARGRRGPISVPSPTFVFPDPATSASAAAKKSSSTSSSSSATSASLAASASGGSASAPPVSDGSEPETDAEDPQAIDPGLLAGGILWQSGRMLRVTSAWLETLLVFVTPSPATQLASVGDLDGDGLDDPIWVDANGALGFTPLADLASGPDATPVALGSLTEGARLLGSGDFDGDGRGDLLVQAASAQVEAWLTTSAGAGDVLALGNAGQAALAGLADFDGNGSDDIAWRGADGSLSIWLSDGATLELMLDSALQIVAAGDLDGDGRAELAVRDASGGLQLVHPLSATPLVPVATGVSGLGGWSALGAGDLDHDGNDDLAFAAAGSLRSVTLPGDDVQPFDTAAWSPTTLLR